MAKVTLATNFLCVALLLHLAGSILWQFIERIVLTIVPENLIVVEVLAGSAGVALGRILDLILFIAADLGVIVETPPQIIIL